ncbi:MAG TPA: hypothetical protein DEQ38_12995 [Elusimicrobia bacterium]|nr:MAG: hypothetical protein A2089_12340 [Elusimicrobia bacterium GWD2_63_28]HCC49013.1 hypothetical protein [Elusimicrobiota bacterium]
MGKALRILGWSLGGLALALGAAALGLKLYFTQARLKALTTDYAARNLRRQVTFDSVALNFSGLSITNLRVSEYPDFKRGEFFSAAAFSVRPSFRALLRRELKINSVSADALSMRVAELKPDTYNFSDLLAPAPHAPKPAAQAPRQAAPAPQLSVSSLKVRGSRFSYANAAGDLAVTLRDINLSASGISPSGLFPVEADFTMAVASPYFKGEIPAALKGRLALGGFAPAKGRAEIEKASFSLGGVRAEAKGSLSNLLEPDAKLALTVKEFSTADLKTVFKGLPPKILLPEIEADTDFKLTAKDAVLRSVTLRAGPVKAVIKGRAAWNPRVAYDLLADLKAQVPEIDTTLLARKAKAFPVPKGLKLPLAEFSARLRLKDGSAEIPSFALESVPLSLSGRASVNFAGALKASGAVKAEIKNLARAAEIAPELLKAYALSGAASAALDFSYAGKPAVSGKAALNGLGASFAGHALTGLSGGIDFTMDSASAKSLRGKLDGSDFSASFKARDLLRHPKAEFDLDLARLALKDPPASAPAAGAAGKGPAGAEPFYLDVSGAARVGAIEHPNFRCGPASLKLSLTNISDDLKALDGSASFTAGPGKLSELYALAGKHKAAKVALYPLLVLQKASKAAKGLKLPDFNNIDFERIEGDYAFADGLMKLNRSSLTSEVADVNSSGTINLPAEKLDMKISTALKKASGISMSVPAGMLVKGTFSDPQVKLDVKSVAEQPAVKKALDKLAPGANKLLKGLFKK